MRTNVVAACVLSVLVGISAAQQVNHSTGAAVSGSNAAAVDQSGANVKSDTRVDASTQTNVGMDRSSSGAASAKSEAKVNSESKNSAGVSNSLAAGTMVNAVLAKSLDSRKLKAGDRVVATVAQDVKSDGKVVVKKGSKLIGHVTEASAKSEGQANSTLGIMFDHALLKDGSQVQVNGVVQALTAAQVAATPFEDSFSSNSASTMSHSGAARSGGGLLGGVASNASAATGTVANVGGNAAGTVNSTLGSTTQVGNGLQGSLSSNTGGVVGLKNISIAGDVAHSTHGSVITSTDKSVRLDSGTQMVLQVVK
ncbi:MAG TPA: hypothetical protein VN577_13220 [Terriglobales bacterium]|nr:hypothetical protein [Terriglobales bacterium]